MNKLKNFIAVFLVGIFLVGCITTQPTSTASKSYQEDLTQYRPKQDSLLKTTDSVKSSFRVTSKDFTAQKDVTLMLDEKLDTIATNNREIRYVDGYTIQIYSGSSSSEAYAVRDSVRKILPQIKINVEYKQPIYKVRVGKFTERLEVQRTMLVVKPKFPSALSVPTRVYIN